MDLTFIYALGVVLAVLGSIFGLAQLKKKYSYIFNAEDIMFVIATFSLSMDIINELNIKEEVMIKKISDIALDSLVFAKNNCIGNVDVKNLAENYSLELCKDLNITLTENRKAIMFSLIAIGLKNIK